MTIAKALRTSLRCVGLFASLLGASASISATAPLDQAQILSQRFGNDAAWYRDNIPLFESSDPRLDAVYYYRWSLFRAHQRDLGAKGYISTEFLDDVPWQREPYASLNDATGFHLAEGRWLRDRRYADDYIDFLHQDGGNDRHFSEAIADAVWSRYLVDHDAPAATRHLPTLRHIYGLWDDHFDFDKGLYWIEPLLDATEYTVSSIDASGGKDGFTGGHAFRPSINAYMVANARAIARLSALAGDPAAAADYAARADTLRDHVLADLWSDKLGHFIDRYRIHNEFVRYWEPIRARELVGYLPWTFGLVENDPRYTGAWAHLLSPSGLMGAAGMRTVEPGYEYYMRQYRYEAATGLRECQWNGPIWPFQTTQVLTGLEHLLHASAPGKGGDTPIGRADYLRLLRQYAALHYQGDRLDLEEDYDPETGKPIVGLARSHHYFHSGFNDLILTGLAGLQPSAGDDLVVDPLLDPLLSGDRAAADRIRYFAVQDVPYHGRRVSVIYDEDGSRYGRGAGLRVYVDGELAAERADLGRLDVPVAAHATPAIARPIDQAVALVRSGAPRPSASSGTDPENLHDAIDGRIWFFPELPNGWLSASPAKTEWFALDFARPITARSAELSFAANGAVQPPERVTLQYMMKGRWVDLSARAQAPANGVVTLTWPEIAATRFRLLINKRPATQVRLVELKLF
jgi:hypothetical protein